MQDVADASCMNPGRVKNVCRSFSVMLFEINNPRFIASSMLLLVSVFFLSFENTKFDIDSVVITCFVFSSIVHVVSSAHAKQNSYESDGFDQAPILPDSLNKAVSSGVNIGLFQDRDMV
jgi:hypothetical protein